MHRTLSLIAIALLGFTSTASAQSFRVMTQNVWKGITHYHDLDTGQSGQCYDPGPTTKRKDDVCYGPCVAYNRAFLAAHLKSELDNRVAVVGLQEVDRGERRSCHEQQDTELAALMGESWTTSFGPAARKSYGNAVLSNARVLWSHHYLFNAQRTGGQKRGFTLAFVQIASGKNIWFASTHLDHKDRYVALRQAGEVADFVKRFAQLPGWQAPAILVGDFNLSSQQAGSLCASGGDCEQTLRAFRDFSEASHGIDSTHLKYTSAGVERHQKLDYVFVYDPGNRIAEVGAPRTKLPCYQNVCSSDHAAVVVDFRFR